MNFEHVKYGLDGASIATIAATFAGILPPIAAFLSIVWLLIQITDNLKKKYAKDRNFRRRSTDR